MKLRIFYFVLAGAVIVSMLGITACSGLSREKSIVVDCEEFEKNKYLFKNIEIGVYETFTLTMCSNPSTGFHWSETAEIDKQFLLRQIDHEYLPPEKGSSSNVTGASARQQWTFTGLKSGQAVVTMEYSQWWEGGIKKDGTLNLTVTIK
jgi:inhibitor of cysteine peptidase